MLRISFTKDLDYLPDLLRMVTLALTFLLFVVVDFQETLFT